MLQIGQYQLSNNLLVAPMAGVTDLPFRKLCRKLGAGYTIGEMVTSKPELWDSLKTSRRLNHDGEAKPIAVQIAGTDAQMMAQATQYNIERGAQIIDINMGCPAKKVCNKYAGAALMRDEDLALEIITAVIASATPHKVPVTLKMRTGWDDDNKNALSIASKAQQAGISLLTVHGRTRQQGYKGQAEYDSIAQIKACLTIPVIANGDIDSPEKAKQVLDYTKADGIMIGRAAQGRPWIFREISHFLTHGTACPPMAITELKELLLEHLEEHYQLYGEQAGTRSVRKHIGWYSRFLPNGQILRQQFNQVSSIAQQYKVFHQYFEQI